jgi:adenylate kinase
MVVILLGPPGVGKGTQGAFLSDDLGWIRIATGDLLRDARREGTELGRRAQTFMDAGELVPDDLIVELVRERLAGLAPTTAVLLDGFPRTVPQAEALGGMLSAIGRTVDGVLLLEAPEEVLVKRIAGRRSCPECGRVYNVHFDPPASANRCDSCGSALVHREDDLPETVTNRLRVYSELTRPLVAHYERSPAPVLRVRGDGSVDEVRAGIREVLARELGVREETS